MLLVVLFVTLCSVYMLTYSGRIESTDTLFLLDATGSLVRYGDTRLDVTAGVRPPPPNQLLTGGLYDPLPDVAAEPLQMLLAAPLYWLADRVPGVGLAHSVYLFNILVSAAAGCVMCLYALVLGYGVRVGVLAALLLGMASIVWPYSKTFFQEPLALLLILLAALLLEKWRLGGYQAVGWLALAVFAALAAIFGKAAAALALPGLLIIAAPRLTWRRLGLLAVVLVALVGLLLLLAEPLGFAGRLNQTLNVLRRPSPSVGVALHSYLLSVGGSVWGTSPALLLALPGVWLARRYRHILAFLAVAFGFALVYAIWQGNSWFGGLSWPPRYLIPVVPFGIIAALPALERALRRPLPNPMTIFVAVILVYGVWIQLSGVTVLWTEYGSALPPEANGLGEWGGGLNVVRYLRWVLIPQLWSQADFDFIWTRVNAPLWPAVFGLLALAGAYVLWRLLRGRDMSRWLALALPVAFVLATLAGLRAIYLDPLYGAPDQPLDAMLAIIESEAQPGDVLLLSDLAYERFFTNYARLDSPRIVGLPFQPGEQPSPEQPPQVVSDNPAVLVHSTTGPLIFALAEPRERLFLLASSGPFIPWSVRPVERFMTTHYYPIRAVETGPQVRLIEYSTAPAPDPYAFTGPAYTSDLRYGEHIRLDGYELPGGTAYRPGDALPLSLYWRTDSPLEVNYTVAWFVRHADGTPLAQGWDTEPGAGFLPTSAWRPGVPVWDNRAVRLPADTLPGQYRLWVVLYATDIDGTIANLPVTGGEVVEGYIGVLPTIIEVDS